MGIMGRATMGLRRNVNSGEVSLVLLHEASFVMEHPQLHGWHLHPELVENTQARARKHTCTYIDKKTKSLLVWIICKSQSEHFD